MEERLNAVKKKQQDIESKIREYCKAIDKDYMDLESQFGRLSEQLKEIKDMETQIDKTTTTGKQQIAELGEIKKSVEVLKKKLAPSTGSLFVRLFLGKVNVKHTRDVEKLALKNEYQKFKRRTDYLFLVFVIIQLWILPNNRIIESLFQVWLLYYYITLALRENILKVNGSNIKYWWIVHHYLSIAISLTILIWAPQSPVYTRFVAQFLWFSFFQALVQMLQTQYQTAKLYKLVSLGKASRMDVTGDFDAGVESSCNPGLYFLLPFLLFMQGWQFYNGYTLIKLFLESDFKLEWQVLITGVLFLSVSLGNFGTTVTTYYEKTTQKTPRNP
jgi:hypothetical protein